ncbi:MAG: hypothetical protein LBN38_05755 [Verrucomicrobiota bacterium]|jgi:lipoate-protein ligase A|nr:hypothetical protein [Verrucomicrobiota bacterium]
MSAAMDGWRISFPEADVFTQMAVDEAVARTAPAAFCLRFYRWGGRGATFGYAQAWADVLRTLPPELHAQAVRRPTGGGVVLHETDMTFSCVIPLEGGWRPKTLYARLHGAVQGALCRCGLSTEAYGPTGQLAPNGPEGASQCFVRPVAMDLMAAGRKILGGALRRMGPAALYQGSLQAPGIRSGAEETEAAMAEAIAQEWGISRWREAPAPDVPPSLLQKYHSAAWNRKR